MFDLTAAEIVLILEALQHKYGLGYAADPAAGRLQAKLSVLLEAKTAPDPR